MKPIVVIGAMLTFLAVVFIAYDFVRMRSCEALLEQSTPTLHANLAFLQAKGDIALGRTEVKALSESAERVNAQLKACCISRQKKYIGNAEYESCLRRAQAYEGRVREVKKNVEQAQAASASRDPGRASQYAARAQEMARIALGTVISVEPPAALSFPPTVPRRPDAAIGGGPPPSEHEPDAAADHAGKGDAAHEEPRDTARDASSD
jgi:hypothetical protein